MKEYKKFLRLSSERDLYTIPQAAFRLNVSRNVFEDVYVETGLIKLVLANGKKLVARSEIIFAIEHLPKMVHKNSLRIVNQGS